eukprot:TRINITY_DN1614_c0_g1_i2.p1 TRINITY_DN1614_c0_g1~~TRINITY_DN1614_c0_g1_i2.p1  ORF type:complete len:941 (+),score=172.23 TRINITY_DN1614_c0_g1_i2:130-2952(+)
MVPLKLAWLAHAATNTTTTTTTTTSTTTTSNTTVTTTLGPALPGWSCISIDQSPVNTTWCDGHCLGQDAAGCKTKCSCQQWSYPTVDWSLGVVSSLSLAATLTVILIDHCGCGRRFRSVLQRQKRKVSQSRCLKWSTVCNFMYSLVFVMYAIVDGTVHFKDNNQCPAKFWHLFDGGCNENGDRPFCFLNCCIFIVPWTGFFCWSSLLWNVMWLVDLTRYTYQPLAPEKLCGIPLLVFYHAATWSIAVPMAFGWSLERFSHDACVEAADLPCVLRRKDITGDDKLRMGHMLALAFVLGALVLMGYRYIAAYRNAGRFETRAQATLRRSVRQYLRAQCLHALMLVICWSLINIDLRRTCNPSMQPFITAIGFTGLGFFLSLDRLLVIGWACWRRRQRSAARLLNESTHACTASMALPLSTAGETGLDASSVHWCSAPVQNESMVRSVHDDIFVSPLHDAHLSQSQRGLVNHRDDSIESGFHASSFEAGPDGYRLVDIMTLISYLQDYMSEEVSVLENRRRMFGPASPSTTSMYAAEKECLFMAAEQDNKADMQSDWRVSRCNGASSQGTAFVVLAPRTFQYLRHIWKTDLHRIAKELAELNTVSLRHAGKSGNFILQAADGEAFMLKTIPETELRQLRQMLPAYWKHMETNPGSMLCRIYGCYTLENTLGSKLHAVLMDCLAPPALARDFQIFDMKSRCNNGGFLAAFPSGLQLPEHIRDQVVGEEGLAADYQWLAQQGIVDYSLLISVYDEPAAAGQDIPDVPVMSAYTFAQKDDSPVESSEAEPPKGLSNASSSAALSFQDDGSSGFGSAARYKTTMGTSIATSSTIVSTASLDRIRPRCLRIGIIDYLVSYDLRKKAESVFKRTLHLHRAKDKVTVIDPDSYAKRQKIFVLQNVLPSQLSLSLSSNPGEDDGTDAVTRAGRLSGRISVSSLGSSLWSGC